MSAPSRPVSLELARLLGSIRPNPGPILPASPSLAYLVPQRSFRERVADFFRSRPAVQILVFGGVPLAITEALKPGMEVLFSSTKASALLVNISSAVIPCLVLAAVLKIRERPEEQSSGDAALLALGSGTTGALAINVARVSREFAEMVNSSLTVGGGVVAGGTAIHSAIVSYNAGVQAAKSAGERALPRNIVATAAATAAITCSATLLNGGGLIMAVALTALSLAGSYMTSRE